MFSDLETLTHPWEEVRKGIMSALDTFGNSCTSTCERQCTDAVRPDDHVRVCFGEASLRRKDIGRVFFDATTHNFSGPKELQRGNLDSNLQFGIDELSDVGVDFSGSLEDDERSRLCDSEVSSLPGGRIGWIYITRYQYPILVSDPSLNYYQLLKM